MIIETIITNIAGSIKAELLQEFKVKNIVQLINTKFNISENLKFHLEEISAWANEINFADLSKTKKLHNVYIHLDTYLYPRSRRIDIEESIHKTKLIDVLNSEKKGALIFGQPGSGKTTSMKYLVSEYLRKIEDSKEKRIPIVIKIRDQDLLRIDDDNESQKDILLKCINYILGLRGLESIFDVVYNKERESSKRTSKEIASSWEQDNRRRLCKYLDSYCSLLIIEGLDESPSEKIKNKIYTDISFLAKHLTNTKVIATTRTGETARNIESIIQYEIAPLEKDQIELFIRKWICDNDNAIKLIKEIDNSPYADTMIRPLTLAHLCALFERNGKIPDKPKTLYKKMVNLLIEEWDQQNNIERYSNYSKFEVDRKFDYLSNLAFELTVKYHKNVFSSAEIISIYNDIYEKFELPKNESSIVAKEIESHTGLLLRSGYDIFEFAHKSMQEYLAAEYISRLPIINFDQKTISYLANELAIATTLSSDCSLYFSELVLKHIQKAKQSILFYSVFIHRIYQEKVNFNRSDNVAIAFLTIYTAYIDAENDSDHGQSFLIPIDNNFTSFERVFYVIAKQNVFNKISSIYHIVNSNKTFDDPLLHLQLTNTDNPLYPKKLYSRQSFLNYYKKIT